MLCRRLAGLLLVFFIFTGCAAPVHDWPASLPAALRDHVEVLSDDTMTGRGPGTPGADLARMYLVEQFQRLGLAPTKLGYVQPVKVRAYFPDPNTPRDLTMANVVGLLPGRGELANQVLVLCAHYDHLGVRRVEGRTVIYPGADDNASGVAAIMQTTVMLIADPDDRDRRSLLLAAVCGEETDLAGSTRLVEQAGELLGPGQQIVAAINLDMVGRLRHSTVYLAGGGEHHAMVRQVADRHGLRVERIPRGLGRSDHLSFLRAGIAAMTLHTGVHDQRHTPEDTAEKIDYAGLARVVMLTRSLVMRLLVEPDAMNRGASYSRR